jgi:AcrR family transcriptional regulator
MAHARTPTPPDDASRKGRKSTQRKRLLDAMILAAGRDGYAHANVSSVIRHARVSRPTFYEYFDDRERCFLAAMADVQRRLVAVVRRAIADQHPERAGCGAISGLVEFAAREPLLMRFFISEPLGAGSRALDARDQAVERLAAMVEQAREHAQPDALAADLSPRVMIGGICRLLASRLRHGEPAIGELQAELIQWVDSYSRPRREHRWPALVDADPPPPSPYYREPPLRAPLPLPPGRPRLSPEEVHKTHRQAILFAAAALAASKGYDATTVADIARLAGVDARAFYRSFADKHDAFMALHELGFQQTMAVTAGAFFAGSSWPQRSWEAGRALTQFLESNPTIAHVGFIEAYAVGPGAVQRIEDSYTAFTIFLQEGYQHVSSGRAPPSRLALEAIVTAVFELVYAQARASRRPRVTALLAQIAFLWLTPFVGADQANAFIESQLSER